MTYIPSKQILKKYADVMVNFALGGGKGMKKGETVFLGLSQDAEPMLVPLIEAITKAGGNYILHYIPKNEGRLTRGPAFFKNASPAQISYVPEKYFSGLVDEVDHVLQVLTQGDTSVLKGIETQKLVDFKNAQRVLTRKYIKKEEKGRLTWTLCLYGTPHAAKKAGMSQKMYWEQIIKACYLNKKDPVAEWKKTSRELTRLKKKLTNLHIDRVHMEGKDVDLWLTIGPKRAWKAGGGANVPSFEVFTSPDWRGTEGWIRFSEPLLRFGKRIEGIELWFEKGKVVKAKAKKNEKVLKQLLSTKNADKLGEFSLTDRRHSNITKFMAETLFDENTGGKYGNTHVAVGSAYKTCYDGDPARVKPATWKKLGYNESTEHTDIVSTTNRKVTAYLPNGKEKVIYKDGEFKI